jgi:N12 class adenine-specific DNA methylase
MSHVDSLKPIIPKDKGPGEIVILPNSPIVSETDLQDFVKESIIENKYEKVFVIHNRETGRYQVEYKGWSNNNINKGVKYTGSDNSALTGVELLEKVLNNSPITVTYTIGTGPDKQTVKDEDATQIAKEKAEALKTAFRSWIWQNSDRSDRIARDYNDKFNCTVNRKYVHPKRINNPTAKVSLPGCTISLRPHQADVVWRGIQSNNVLMAHEVGAGKTFASIAMAMELKRLGLRKKTMVVVPNNLADSWGNAIRMAYPGANVLVSNAKNFSTTSRKEFVNKAAFNDYDIIVMRYSHYEKIPLNPQIEAEFIQERLAKLLDAAEKQRTAEKDRKSVV